MGAGAGRDGDPDRLSAPSARRPESVAWACRTALVDGAGRAVPAWPAGPAVGRKKVLPETVVIGMVRSKATVCAARR